MRVFWIIVVLVAAFFLVRELEIRRGDSGDSESSVHLLPTIEDSGPVLSLISAKCTTQYGVRNCEGFVKNISSRSLGGDITQQIIAEVVWVNDKGVPQSSDGGYVMTNPLSPGQESAWKSEGYDDPTTKQYRVQFKTVLGPVISTRDDRQP